METAIQASKQIGVKEGELARGSDGEGTFKFSTLIASESQQACFTGGQDEETGTDAVNVDVPAESKRDEPLEPADAMNIGSPENNISGSVLPEEAANGQPPETTAT